jgi:hypothetical protein
MYRIITFDHAGIIASRIATVDLADEALLGFWKGS